jgi:hypothetical protein
MCRPTLTSKYVFAKTFCVKKNSILSILILITKTESFYLSNDDKTQLEV